MDLFFPDYVEETKEEEEARKVKEAKEEAEREERRLRRVEEMERERQERLARKKAEEERWYIKQPRILSLEDCFEQGSILLPDGAKQEFKEFIPKIVELLRKDPNMVKRMEAVKDQKGLESFLTTWYYRLELNENEREILDNWLEKFEKQVMAALRQKINIKSDNQSQIVFDFFENLKEKGFRRRMKQITADMLQMKIQQQRQQKLNIATDETRKTFAQLKVSGVSDEVINELAEQSYNAIEAQREGPSSEPVPMRISQSLREAMLNQLSDHFVSMNLSEPTQVGSDDEEEEEDDGVQVVEQVDYPEGTDYSRALPEKPKKSVNFYKATETQREEHQRKKYLDKNAKAVKFVDYKSPKNKMRIFMKPNGYISETADDSPITPFVDLTLKEGRKTMDKIPHPHIVMDEYVPDQLVPKYFGRQALAAFRSRDWLQGYSGNLLGRFWIVRKKVDCNDDHQKAQHTIRCINGVLDDYNEPDLKKFYSHMMANDFEDMRRSNRRETMPIAGKIRKILCDPMNGVLLLTDWRLLYLEEVALLNACVKHMPTNIGDTFFDSMTAYLIELINDPNIEIHTIIFAFGGHPSFKKETFKRFWQKLIKHTLKSIDVVWTAQDWCDGLESTEEELAQLTDFNNYVKKIFEIMSATGHSNYKYCNIREKYKIPTKKLSLTFDKNGEPDVSVLQDLYFAYFDWFTGVCDLYCNGVYFTHNQRKNMYYTENNGRFPRKQDIGPEAKQ